MIAFIRMHVEAALWVWRRRPFPLAGEALRNGIVAALPQLPPPPPPPDWHPTRSREIL